MQPWIDALIDPQGEVVDGATVTVRDSLGAIATIWADNGTTSKPNPFVTGTDVSYSFFAVNGTYTVTISKNGYGTVTHPGVVLFDPADDPSTSMESERILGRTSPDPGAPEQLTLTEALDLVSASVAHGDILYRGADDWERLAAGTDGHALMTNGAGAAPEWAAVGYINLPQNSQSAAYTTVLSDQGKHLLHPSADTTARTFTIDSNANVAYPIGTCITFVNQASAGTLTISITSDTMRLAGAGTTGSRTLAANGVATALKITSTEWIISGTGLT